MKNFLFLFLFLFPPLLNAQTITYSGTNVGIGSAQPGQTLDVQGTIRATSFTGQNGHFLNGTPSTGFALGTVYSASTDGYFSCVAQIAGLYCTVEVKTDGSNPPTTIASIGDGTSSYMSYESAGAPVKKGDYFECVILQGSPSNYASNFTPSGS